MNSLSVLLSAQIPKHETIERLNELTDKPWEIDADSVDVAFAQKAAFERMIPLEQSPLDLESLAKLVTSATGAGLGAYAGFVLFGSSPLLFVAAPFGMILFGAAKGIADALEQGLREKLLWYLKGDNERIQESSNDDSEQGEDEVTQET
jgi:hypothetical protein